MPFEMILGYFLAAAKIGRKRGAGKELFGCLRKTPQLED
jgi:hypothetical protein